MKAKNRNTLRHNMDISFSVQYRNPLEFFEMIVEVLWAFLKYVCVKVLILHNCISRLYYAKRKNELVTKILIPSIPIGPIDKERHKHLFQ